MRELRVGRTSREQYELDPDLGPDGELVIDRAAAARRWPWHLPIWLWFTATIAAARMRSDEPSYLRLIDTQIHAKRCQSPQQEWR
jgi:hypothetical protein